MDIRFSSNQIKSTIMGLRFEMYDSKMSIKRLSFHFISFHKKNKHSLSMTLISTDSSLYGRRCHKMKMLTFTFIFADDDESYIDVE